MKIRFLPYLVYFVFGILAVIFVVFLIRVTELRVINSIEVTKLDYGENYTINFNGLVADSLNFRPSIFIHEVYVRNHKNEVIAHFESVELFFGFINLLLGNGVVSKLVIGDMAIHSQHFYPFLQSVFDNKQKDIMFDSMNWKFEFDQAIISNLKILADNNSLTKNNQNNIIPEFNNVILKLREGVLEYQGQIWQGQKEIYTSGRIYELADILKLNALKLSFEIASGEGLFNGKLDIGDLQNLDQIYFQLDFDSQDFFHGLDSSHDEVQKVIEWLARIDTTKGSLSIDGKWPHLRLVKSNLTTELWSDSSIVTEGQIGDLYLLSDISFGFVAKIADTSKLLKNVDQSNNNLLKLLFTNNSLNLKAGIDGDLDKGLLLEIFEMQTNEGVFVARLAFDGNFSKPIINLNLSSEEVRLDSFVSETSHFSLSNLLTKPFNISSQSEVYGNVRINKLKLKGLSDIKDLSLDLIYKDNIITGGLANFLIYDGSYRGFVSKEKGDNISHSLYLEGSKIDLKSLQTDFFNTNSLSAKGDMILTSKNNEESNFFENWTGSMLIYDGKLSLFESEQVPKNDLYNKLVSKNTEINKFNCGFLTFEANVDNIDHKLFLEGDSINLLINGTYTNSSKIIQQEINLELIDKYKKNNIKYYPLSFVKNFNNDSFALEDSAILISGDIFNHNLKNLIVGFPKENYPSSINLNSDNFNCLIFKRLNIIEKPDLLAGAGRENTVGLQIETFSDKLNTEIQEAMQYLNPEHNEAEQDVRNKSLEAKRDELIKLFF